jgi:hypothetical protein
VFSFKAIKRAKKLNFQVLDIDETKPHWKEAFLHPKQTMNMLIQLAEHNPSLAKPGEAWDGIWSGTLLIYMYIYNIIWLYTP